LKVNARILNALAVENGRGASAGRCLAYTKHQDDLVEDCPLGIVTKHACKQRLLRLSKHPSRYALHEMPLPPIGCSRCHHADGILIKEVEEE